MQLGFQLHFQANPKECHYAIKRIIIYLKGTFDYEKQYDRSSDLTICTYINMDWVGSIDYRKSTSGEALFFRGRVVSWLRKKQDQISKSIVEVEYVATKNNYNQVMWMKQMLKDVVIEFVELVIIYYDNTIIVSMSQNLILHSNTKHISIQYHILREKAIEKDIRLEYVSTKDQTIDIFMKPFPNKTFEYSKGMCEVMSLPTSKQMMQRVHQSSGAKKYCQIGLNVDGSLIGDLLEIIVHQDNQGGKG